MIQTLIYGDCLSEMAKLHSASVDMVLCDMPYGVTSCKWDSILNLETMWKEYYRICKPHAAIILMAQQPFTTTLISSNIKRFTQILVWDKGKGSNPLLSGKRIMQSHEDVVRFGGSIYNPQFSEGKPYVVPRTGGNRTNRITSSNDREGFTQSTKDTSKRFPLSVLKFSIHCGSKIHPTQKPEKLMEYLIKTYTNENMTVLDNCMGSGTTGVACKNTGRGFVGIENDEEYFKIAHKRIAGEWYAT